MTIVVLLLSACVGSFDPFVATNGVLGGLVAITASSPMVETEGSFVIGVLSGFLVFYGSKLVLRLKVRYFRAAQAFCFCFCKEAILNPTLKFFAVWVRLFQ